MSWGARFGSTQYLLQRLSETRLPSGIYPYNYKRKITKRHKMLLLIHIKGLRKQLDELEAKIGDPNGQA